MTDIERAEEYRKSLKQRLIDEDEQLNKENVKLKDKTKRIIEYLLNYPYHAREEDFMQHIKEIEDFLKELEND